MSGDTHAASGGIYTSTRWTIEDEGHRTCEADGDAATLKHWLELACNFDVKLLEVGPKGFKLTGALRQMIDWYAATQGLKPTTIEDIWHLTPAQIAAANAAAKSSKPKAPARPIDTQGMVRDIWANRKTTHRAKGTTA